MEAQRGRPGKDVTDWVYFFLDCLKNIQEQLMRKLAEKERRESVGVREQHIYSTVENNPGISSGQIAEKLKIPSPTVKRILADLVATRNLIVHGTGRGTRYSISVNDLVKHDIGIRFTTEVRAKTFTLQHLGSFLRIKKIVLTPLFDWKHPDEWSKRLSQNGLFITIEAATSKGQVFHQSYSVLGFTDPSYFQPVFVVNPNIVLPDQLRVSGILKIDYPIKCSIELAGSVDIFDFDVMLVADEG